MPITINVGAPPITITITGPDTVDVVKGTSANNVLALFTATDNTGRVLTPYLSLSGSYNLNTPGTYSAIVTVEGVQKAFTLRVDSPVLSNSSGSPSFTLPAGSDETDILEQFQVIGSVTGNTLSGYTLTLHPGINFNTPGGPYTTKVKIAGVTPEVENITFFNIDVTIN